jgi:hypothetical protein
VGLGGVGRSQWIDMDEVVCEIPQLSSDTVHTLAETNFYPTQPACDAAGHGATVAIRSTQRGQPALPLSATLPVFLHSLPSPPPAPPPAPPSPSPWPPRIPYQPPPISPPPQQFYEGDGPWGVGRRKTLEIPSEIPAYPEAELSTLYDGLLCYLPLHGGLPTDTSGLGNHATAVGDVTATTDYDGRVNHAAALAAGASLDVSSCAQVDGGARSVAMWVYTAVAASTPTQCATTAAPATLAWKHVAGVVQSAAVTALVVNGHVLDAATSPLATHVLSAVTAGTVGGGTFEGAVSDVRLWSRELSAMELAALFLTPAAAVQLGPDVALSIPLLSQVRCLASYAVERTYTSRSPPPAAPPLPALIAAAGGVFGPSPHHRFSPGGPV